MSYLPFVCFVVPPSPIGFVRSHRDIEVRSGKSSVEWGDYRKFDGNPLLPNNGFTRSRSSFYPIDLSLDESVDGCSKFLSVTLSRLALFAPTATSHPTRETLTRHRDTHDSRLASFVETAIDPDIPAARCIEPRSPALGPLGRDDRCWRATLAVPPGALKS